MTDCFTLNAGHVVPEAINGGPIALVKDGDKIVIDAGTREINWLVDDEEKAKRQKEGEASGLDQIREKRGILYKYARDVKVSRVVPGGSLKEDADGCWYDSLRMLARTRTRHTVAGPRRSAGTPENR